MLKNGEPFKPRFGGFVTLPLYIDGKIAGFTSRALDENHKPKYMTSAASSAFDRSKVIFNIQNAQKHMDRSGYCVIAEGPFDAITLSIRGVKNAVSCLGTEFNDTQIPNTRVVSVFDNDLAGEKATGHIKRYRSDSLSLSFPKDVKDIDQYLRDNPDVDIKAEIESLLDPEDKQMRVLLRRILQASIENPEIFYEFSEQLNIEEIPDCDEKKFFQAVMDYGLTVDSLVSNKEVMLEAGISESFALDMESGMALGIEDCFWIARMVKRSVVQKSLERLSHSCSDEQSLNTLIIEAERLSRYDA